MINTNNIFKTEYPCIDNIVRTIHEHNVTGRNKRYQDLYDWFVKFYTFAQKTINLYR